MEEKLSTHINCQHRADHGASIPSICSMGGEPVGDVPSDLAEYGIEFGQ